MQRMFFHNRYDKTSEELLSTLDPEVTVIDVFGGDERARDYKLVSLPYMIDKEVVLVTQAPYYTGLVSLTFNCKNHLGENITDEPTFTISINGQEKEVKAVNGLFVVEIDCLIPLDIDIEIKDLNGQGYMPTLFTINVEVAPV